MSVSDGLPNRRQPRISGWISRQPERAALALVAACAVALPISASAQASSCAIPSNIPVPHSAGPSASEPIRRLPIGAYTLSLSWSPEYCRGKTDNGSFQCDGSARFGFVLHGLWPDGNGSQWPQYCKPAAIVPPPVVKGMLCTTPSADLLQHEWAKHGTCGWSEPAAYFAQSRKLYQALRYPDMMALSRRDDLTVGAFRAEFARANPSVPGFSADSIRVTVKDGWLNELWLCLDRKMRFARCRTSQEGGKASGESLKIWRGVLNDR